MIKKFKDFLVLHDAYDKYMSNWDEKYNYDGIPYRRDYLVCAFQWDNSPEGFEFWGNLDNLWLDVVRGESKRLTFDRLLEA